MKEGRAKGGEGRPLLLRVLGGEPTAIPPIWFMRQAGRFLPEYRAVREKAGSFLNLCFNPELAAEVTLQPVRRFDLDAAILFADILLIPHAMGQKLSFVEGEGPRLDPPVTAKALEGFRKRNIRETLALVFETVRRVKRDLDPSKALIGFAGAPWTVATYMLAGGPHKDAASLRSYFYRDETFIRELVTLLADATTDYLIAQIDAGADAVQLFDTWAAGLPENLTRTLSVEPMRQIAAAVKAARPETPVIFFPKGVGALLPEYAMLEECDAIGIDSAAPRDFVRKTISDYTAVQGGLDPLLVVEGGEAMKTAARKLLRCFAGTPYIFNLGHGLVPETPPENVGALVDFVRSGEWMAPDA